MKFGPPVQYAVKGEDAIQRGENLAFQSEGDSQHGAFRLADFWDRLGEGGDPTWQACGWLKDKFGLSWQIVPEAFFAMITDKDAIKSERAMRAMMQMEKLDLPALQRAYDGH